MDVLEMIKRARTGDKEARNQVVEENIGLVWNIVKRFHGRGYDAEDLFQIGCIGLIKAIDNFDLEYDVKFSTYAVPMILGEIKRFLRDDGMIKVSRTVKENSWKVRRAAQRLDQEMGRSATIEEIAAATELEPEDIVIALEAGYEVDSIYRPVFQSEGNEIYLIDQVVAGRQGSVGHAVKAGGALGIKGEAENLRDEEKEQLLDRMLLEQLLDTLGKKDRMLIELRYFQNMTQTQVAKRLGISQVQVSRLEKKILERLRAQV